MRNAPGNFSPWLLIGAAALVVAGDRADRPGGRSAGLAMLTVPFLASEDRDRMTAFHARTFAGPVAVRRDGAIAYRIGARRGEAATGPWRRTTGAAMPPATIIERLVGAAPSPRGGARSAAGVSVLRGERSRWRESVPAFDAVDLGEAWPGIRVTLRARAESIEKIFVVAPGASLASIAVSLEGVQALRVDTRGRLIAAAAGGEIAFSEPVAWQDGWLGRKQVEVAYATDGVSYRFLVGDYDRTRPLWIDPLLQSTYLGGGASQVANGIAVHPTTGDVYVVGTTFSPDFPGISGGADTSISGSPPDNGECFVARLSATLTTLVQATYLGGDGADECFGISIHPTSGEVYVAGFTEMIAGFPGLAGGADTTFAGSTEGFVARLAPSLTSIGQATLLGGTGGDSAADVAFDSTTGDVYVVGTTDSADFPGVAGGAETTVGSGGKGFVARLPASLTSLSQSTYFGGTAAPSANVIAVHPSTGDVYIGGNIDFVEPGEITAVAGGADTTHVDREGYLARLNGALTAVLQSTYLGGAYYDLLTGIAVHPVSGDIYATGVTQDVSGFPGIAGGADTTSASFELFVSRLSPSLTSIVQSTYVGGDGNDSLSTNSEPSIAIHPGSGDVYIASATDSTTNFPGIGTAEFKTVAGTGDAVVVRLAASLTTLRQSALAGASSEAHSRAIAISPFTGDVYIGGWLVEGPNILPRVAGGADTTTVNLDAWAQRYSSDLSAPKVVVPVPVNGTIALALLMLAMLGAFSRARRAGR